MNNFWKNNEFKHAVYSCINYLKTGILVF